MNAFLLAKCIKKGWLAQDADTSKLNAQEICGQKMASGELGMDEFNQWCAEHKAEVEAKQAESTNRLKSVMAEANAPVLGALNELVGILKANAAPAQAAASATANTAVDTAVAAATKAASQLAQQAADDPATKLFQQAAGADPNIRVVKASESYTHVKTAVCYTDEHPNHPNRKRGMPVQFYEGEAGIPKGIDTLSQREYALIGAYAKHQARKAGLDVRLNEHEEQLVKELVHEHTFTGAVNKNFLFGRKPSDFETKTILDSATSGGNEAVPEFFDNAIITTPQLYGELFPYVNVIPMSRGSSVDGFSMGNPTFVSTAEGSAVSPFTTTSYIAAFDTTIFPATCAIELGLDWESDAVANFGATLMAVIGQSAMKWLDEQIAIGDGTTEPQGILTATGTAVASANGTDGPLTYNDALALAFGLTKPARNAFGGNRVRYVMNDANYKHFMAIVTGVTGDTRPIFGMNFKDYMLGDYPVSVQNDITVSDIAFCNLAAYRMYRRQGLEFVMDETGRTNRLANTKLVMARMRWGGQLALPTFYCAQMTDAKQYTDLITH